MVNFDLAKSYFLRCKIRFEVLPNYLNKEDYADVIRESQEIIELMQKGLLISVGIQPPKWHDVTKIILENDQLFTKDIILKITELKNDIAWLRGQRELSFYGDMDFIPEESYTKEDALKAIACAESIINLIKN